MRFSLLASAVALCLCFAGTLVAAQVPPPANMTFLSFDGMVSHLRSELFNNATRDAILDSLAVSMSTYAFRSLARDSSIGAPDGASFTEQKIDLINALAVMRQTEYASEFDMNEAFALLFRSLNDAHTAYQKPTAGQVFALPFKLQVRLVNSSQATRPQQQAVYLRELLSFDAAYAQVYGASPLANATSGGSPVHLSSVDNFEVIYVDGVYALPSIWSIATDATSFRVGLSKDEHTRFNLLTNGFSAVDNGPPGYFTYRSLRTYGIPERSSLTLTLRDPNGDPSTLYDITYRWFGIVPNPTPEMLQAGPAALGKAALEGKAYPRFPLLEPLKEHPILREQQLEHHYWTIVSLQHPAAENERLALGKLVGKTLPSLPAAQPLLSAGASSLSSDPSLSIPGEISFSVLADGTGVLRIYSFNPDSVPDFLQVVQQGITMHQRPPYNGTRLVIDLRANGGGDICLGYAVLRFVFPQLEQEFFHDDVSNDSPFGRYDMPIAAATMKLAELGAQNLRDNPLNNTCDFMTPCAWLRADTQTPFTSIDWYAPSPPRSLIRGATVPDEFTNLFHDNCQDYWSYLAPATVNPGYAPENTVVVAGGMCGSTCSVFSSFIQFNQLAKTVAMGGIVDTEIVTLMEPMQLWSFPGGQVIQLAAYQEIAASYGVAPDDPLVPQSYPNGASQTWAFREIYPWNDVEGSYPLEYLHVPAHFHFGWKTNSTDDDGLYQQLIIDNAIFAADTCVPGFAEKSCAVANGQGVQQCLFNKLQATCMAVTCDGGYFLQSKNGSSVCLPCAVGTYRHNRTSDRSFLAQSVCSPCKQVVNVTLGEGMSCTGRFTTEAQAHEQCPFVFDCAYTAHDKVDKKSFQIALGVLIPTAVVLLITSVFFYKKYREASTTGQINPSYHAMP